ncbi:hypothetical protein [Novosphingopyxis baekryungensis]|uniref:hypothetical protein n=1 Tax=Novosphingopyxis baekryungensis TaxID=279369 RepID=UPI0003B44AB4|nr:hypothetical protein [Novosphingopyxis baekryungensis]
MAEIQGTVFLVHDTWYLRYSGGGGSMILISGSAELLDQLIDNKVATLEGHLSRDQNGCLQGVSASALKTINK